MQIKQSHLLLLGALVVLGLLIGLLGDILLPFVLGFALAYLLDPLADRLEALGMRRVLATAMITLLFVCALLLALMLGVPILVEQISLLLAALPGYMQALQSWVEAQQIGGAQNDMIASLNQAAMEYLQTAAKGLVLSGLSVVNLLTVVFITPIVTIYMLNDWDRMVAAIDALLPSHQAALIRRLASQINTMLAGFVRGQIMVCLGLGLIYAIGLSLVGLKGGLLLGFVAGLVSFVPYVGAAFGLVLAGLLGLGQFGLDWIIFAQLAAVFFVGQFMEGNVLTPRLVGDRVRLHPVWIMFALLAMGQLFGFLGLLLAVPIAAIFGVLVRFGAGVYERDFVQVSQEDLDG